MGWMDGPGFLPGLDASHHLAIHDSGRAAFGIMGMGWNGMNWPGFLPGLDASYHLHSTTLFTNDERASYEHKNLDRTSGIAHLGARTATDGTVTEVIGTIEQRPWTSFIEGDSRSVEL